MIIKYNNKHLEVLRLGVEVWNRWREKNPNVRPNLQGLNLVSGHESQKNIADGVNLSRVNLSGANMRAARMRHGYLVEANFSGADLTGADFNHADLSSVNFSNAILTGSDLADTNLTGANLSNAVLHKADLFLAILTDADLSNADFTGAAIGSTLLIDIDLSKVKGLDKVKYFGPSSISIESIYKSRGEIPEEFLRGIGAPDNFITYMTSLTGKAIEFYSCFISYSSRDQTFADRLYADLQNKGVRCWFAPEDLRIGDKIRPRIDETIRLHDKLLLVLSKTSVNSQWVEQEVETALAMERKQGRTVLFPIRIDDTVMKINSGWPALIKNTRNIGDFKKWKNHDVYQKAFNRLLRDLKSKESGATYDY